MSERHDQFWAEFLGIAAADLCTAGLSIVSHVGLAGYRGVWFFLRGSRLVVSAPDLWLERIRGVLARAPEPPALPDHPALVELFGSSIERWIGPAFNGSLEASRFRACPSVQVRSLTDADSDAVSDFREACPADDWNDSSLDNAPSLRAGYFDEGRLVSMAGFRPLSATAGDPCVLTHPEYRGRGHAKAAVSSVLAAAIARGHVALYRTLEANVAAVRLAFGLGYERYAQHIAVRLTTDAPAR